MFEKRQSATEIVKYISVLDGAIDQENPNFKYEEFLRTRDEHFMPAKPGAVLTKFHLKPLEPDAYKKAMANEGIDQRCYELVAYSLKAVENYHADGRPCELKLDKISGLERVNKRTLDAIYDPDLFRELAGIVAAISRIDPLRFLA